MTGAYAATAKLRHAKAKIGVRVRIGSINLSIKSTNPHRCLGTYFSDSLLYSISAIADMPKEKVKNIQPRAMKSRIVASEKVARLCVGRGAGSYRSDTTTVNVIEPPNTETLNMAPT